MRRWICGKILQPPEPFNGFARGPHINSDEADEFYKSLIGTPVYVEHTYDESVGEVIGVFPGPKGDVYGVLFLDKHSKKANDVLGEIKKGLMCGLSVGQLAYYDEKTGVRNGKSMGIEISIVDEGAIPNSRIICYRDGKNIFVSQSGVLRVFNMALDSHNDFEKSLKEAKAAVSAVGDVSKSAESSKADDSSFVRVAPKRLVELEEKAKQFDELNQSKRVKLQASAAAATKYIMQVVGDSAAVEECGREAVNSDNHLAQRLLIAAASAVAKEHQKHVQDNEKHTAAFGMLEQKYRDYVNGVTAPRQPVSVLDTSRTGDSRQIFDELTSNIPAKIDHTRIQEIVKDLEMEDKGMPKLG